MMMMVCLCRVQGAAVDNAVANVSHSERALKILKEIRGSVKIFHKGYSLRCWMCS